VCGCVYKIENFRTLSAPSEIASLREAISSSAAFEIYYVLLFVTFVTNFLPFNGLIVLDV
jgi:hypothetical protein